MSVTLISSLQRTTRCIALKHQNASIQGNDLTFKFCSILLKNLNALYQCCDTEITPAKARPVALT